MGEARVFLVVSCWLEGQWVETSEQGEAVRVGGRLSLSFCVWERRYRWRGCRRCTHVHLRDRTRAKCT